MLLAKIEENSLLSHLSKVTIKNILNQYWRFLIEENSEKKTEKPRGIPRGIGVSAYLSEIYMKDIDNRIKSLPNVFFYARYVDDIIVMFAPNNNIDHDQNDLDTYKNKINLLIEKADLVINENKTKVFDIKKMGFSKILVEELTYLGYKFIFGCHEEINTNGKKEKKRKKLEIRLSKERHKKYMERIELSFESYRKVQAKYPNKKNQYTKLLIQRIKYLTSNTNLNGHKKNVHIGIQFSNSFLTDPLTDLKELDFRLKELIKSIEANMSTNVINKLNSFSFKEGFDDKIFHRFKSVTLENIIKIWK